MKTEVRKWIGTRTVVQNFVWGSSLEVKGEQRMSIQGIDEALEWAFYKGAADSNRLNTIDRLAREGSALERELNEVKPKFLKLAEDFQAVVQENISLKESARRQAETLTAEVEGLKAKLDKLESERDFPRDFPPPKSP